MRVWARVPPPPPQPPQPQQQPGSLARIVRHLPPVWPAGCLLVGQYARGIPCVSLPVLLLSVVVVVMLGTTTTAIYGRLLSGLVISHHLLPVLGGLCV